MGTKVTLVLLFLSFFFNRSLAQPCNITNFETYANVNGCDPFWTLDGVVEFQNQPTSGTLVLEDCEGNTTVIATAPFTSPVNYSGVVGPATSMVDLNCDFDVYFSDNLLCNQTNSILLPANPPPEEAGTVTQNLIGNGLNSYILCDGDVLTITSNDDYDIQTTNPTDNPSLIYFVYTCPPSLGGIGINPALDPCFQNYFTSEDITLTNNGGSADPLIQALGNPTDNIFYIVPITAVNVVGNNITITQDCYDLALDQMTTVQYLNPIVTSLTENCNTGEAIINIQGGYTQLYLGPGTNNTVSNIQPPSLGFNGTSIGNNGNLILDNLSEGQAYSFDITGANGCTASFASTFITPDDASFTYPDNSYCLTDVDPSPTVTGLNGGSFSSTPGLTLDPVSGTIDLSTSLPGNYTITYQTPPSLCVGIDTFAIVIHDLPLVTASNSGPVCVGESVNISASNALTYTWDNGLGVGQNQTINPATNTTYSVIGTDINGCTNSASTTVLLNPLPTVDAGVDFSICLGDLATLNGSGAVTYLWDNAVTNGVSFTPLTSNTYTVTGTDVNGCSNTDQIQITVNLLPIIDAGVDQTVCENTLITLNATGAPTIVWDNGVNNNVPFTQAVGTITYTATGTDANGCSNSDVVDVTVNPNPVVNITGNTQYCAGSNSVLTANTAATTFIWSSGGNLQTENVTAANNPITVTVTDANNCSATSNAINVVENQPSVTNTVIEICQGQTALIHGVNQSLPGVYTDLFADINGCDSTSNVTLTVNPLPIIDAGVNQTVCDNTLITLNATGAPTIVWDNGVNNNVPFTQAVGTITYTATGTDANGCSNSDVVAVTVNPNPVVDAGADNSICENEQVTLNASGNPTGLTFTWDNGAVDGIAFTPPLGNTSFTLTGTDANGCSGTDVVDISVNPLPVVSAGADQIICEGTTVTLTATGADTYLWDNGVINGIPFNPSANNTYTVVGTTIFGCSASDNVTVTIEALVDVNFSADELIGCAPLDVFFNGNTVAGSTCLWDFGNGISSTNCGSVSTSYFTSGCYDVTYTLTSANGCASEQTLFDYICVEEDPIASFSSTSSQISVDDSEVTFLNNSTGATTYVWDFNQQGTSTSVNPTYDFEVEEAGQYTIVLEAFSELGCSDTFSLVINAIEDLIFYVPNTFTPGGNELNNVFTPVFTQGFDPFDFNLLIFNRWGEVVFESNNPNIGWDGTYGTQGGGLAKTGTYIWQIEFKTEQSDERISVKGHVNLLR